MRWNVLWRICLLATLALTVEATAAETSQPRGYSIPTIDLADEAHRQVIVDREAGQYLGHPTTVLLEDRRTMLIVYPKGHGRGAILMKRSTDGGLTWSDRLPTPENWQTSLEVPTMYRVVDNAGVKRLIMFSGLYPIRISVSNNDGVTWSPLAPIGEFGGIVAMASLERLQDGDYMALFHDDGRFIDSAGKGRKNPPLFTVYKTLSQDGGLTWGAPQPIVTHSAAHLCEPGLVRSPDGKQLAVLLRENSRQMNSFVVTSDDEGKTWSSPRELPGSLTGDRHVAKYAPDGRLIVTFRDKTHESPTKGDWVAWVGAYDDIINGREGQYRVRLMKNFARTRTNAPSGDCAYPGLELLPDGTFVTTTYGHWTEGEQPYIVSVRLRLEELDSRAPAKPSDKATPLAIGDRRELFIDRHLIDRMSGGARQVLHHPESREISLTTDAPWEGNACGYPSVFQDGDKYRLYYHGAHYRHGGKPAETRPTHPVVLCYAESDDGIHWRRPELGLHDFEKSNKNNIILTPESVAAFKGDPAHTAVFLDRNSNCPADERYKCVIVGKPHDLYIMKSADGIHFRNDRDKPLIIEGAMDSENLAFWDPLRKEYRAYWRAFMPLIGEKRTTRESPGVRSIRTARSYDGITWTDMADVRYIDSPITHLYTNQIQPYYRAPHILIGFPMRYMDRGWSDSMRALPGLEERQSRSATAPRYGTAVTDCLVMTSRDGVTFDRWNEGFLRPGPHRQGSWVYGDNMISWGMVETASPYLGAPNELSLYAIDHYWQGSAAVFRRLAMRVDGFISIQAPLSGGELITKPLVFDGARLTLNAATSAAGGIHVEIQDPSGKSLPGYSLADCPELFGDELSHEVRWRAGGDVKSLAGKPVRLRFVLRDADLYSFRFEPAAK